MNPTEALRMLVSAAEVANLPKRDHIALEQAAKVLAEAIAPKESADAPAPE